MSVVINPKDMIEYFNNVACEIKANQLYSFYIARSVRYLQLSTKNQDREHNCFCFVCQIQQLLIETLILLKHYRLLFVVNGENYLTISDDFLCNLI